MTVQLKIPDLGDFESVEVIEVLVSPGDVVAVEDSLITLETDKASMDIPAEQAGQIMSIDVTIGDRVSTGDAFATIEPAADQAADDVPVEAIEETRKMTAPEIVAATHPTGDATHSAQLVVIGAGPGGYTAAFRAADLGMDVILVERWPMLGGVCLNVGCIPSKALLHAAKVIDDAAAMADHGVVFGKPEIDAGKLRDWKNEVVGKLTGGLSTMAKQRKVRVLTGRCEIRIAAIACASTMMRLSISKTALSRRVQSPSCCRACRTIRVSSIPRVRSKLHHCQDGCSSWAAGSLAWKWPVSTARWEQTSALSN